MACQAYHTIDRVMILSTLLKINGFKHASATSWARSTEVTAGMQESWDEYHRTGRFLMESGRYRSVPERLKPASEKGVIVT